MLKQSKVRRQHRESDRRTGGIRGTGHSQNSTGVKGSKHTSTSDQAPKESEQVKVINYEALPDLGCITHVVFDKTDTLTMSTMHVC